MKKTVDVVIKTLNEEKTIERCIISAKIAMRGFEGKIILVDSLSSDKTVEIAKKFPDIKIYQIKDEQLRTCGLGPQIGYHYGTSNFVCVVDGDMIIKSDFIRKGINLITKDVAGVSGLINHIGNKHDSGVKNANYRSKNAKTGMVDILVGIAIYKREYLDNIGYLTNPYLFSNEEADICYKLTDAGYKLVRMNIIAVDHYVDDVSSTKRIISKFNNNLLRGPGQVIKYNLGNGLIYRHIYRLRIIFLNFIVLLLGIFAVLSSVLTGKVVYLICWSLLIVFLLTIITIKKKFNIRQIWISLIDWNITTISSMRGFLLKRKSISEFDYGKIREIQ